MNGFSNTVQKKSKFDTSVDFVKKPELWTDPRRYGLGGYYADIIAINQSSLAKIKARTPKGVSQQTNNSSNHKKATPQPAPKKTTPAPTPNKKTVPDPAKKGAKSDKIYIVKQGDTLRSIAEGHNISLKKLMKINGFKKHKRVSIGEEVKLSR